MPGESLLKSVRPFRPETILQTASDLGRHESRQHTMDSVVEIALKIWACAAAEHPAGTPATVLIHRLTINERLQRHPSFCRVLLLDMLLGNPDRLPCSRLMWAGNSGNLLAGCAIAAVL